MVRSASDYTGVSENGGPWNNSNKIFVKEKIIAMMINPRKIGEISPYSPYFHTTPEVSLQSNGWTLYRRLRLLQRNGPLRWMLWGSAHSKTERRGRVGLLEEFPEFAGSLVLIFEWLCFKETRSVCAYLLKIGWVGENEKNTLKSV